MIHESWCYSLSDILPNYIRAVENASNICPRKENVFNAFTMPIDNVNIVLLGQDPYPTPDMAIGYAFAINPKFNKPPSMRMIEKEINHPITDVSLSNWIKQGVLLLNTALTINCKDKISHINTWKPFTQKVVHVLAKYDVVWIMLGNYAKGWIPEILKINKNAAIVIAAHPAAEVYRKNAGFLNSGVFIEANSKLEAFGKPPINW